MRTYNINAEQQTSVVDLATDLWGTLNHRWGICSQPKKEKSKYPIQFSPPSKECTQKYNIYV